MGGQVGGPGESGVLGTFSRRAGACQKVVSYILDHSHRAFSAIGALPGSGPSGGACVKDHMTLTMRLRAGCLGTVPGVCHTV